MVNLFKTFLFPATTLFSNWNKLNKLLNLWTWTLFILTWTATRGRSWPDDILSSFFVLLDIEMWQPSVTTRKEYKNSYQARVGLFMTEFVISGQSHKAILNGVACEHIRSPALFQAAGKSRHATKAGKLCSQANGGGERNVAWRSKQRLTPTQKHNLFKIALAIL